MKKQITASIYVFIFIIVLIFCIKLDFGVSTEVSFLIGLIVIGSLIGFQNLYLGSVYSIILNSYSGRISQIMIFKGILYSIRLGFYLLSGIGISLVIILKLWDFSYYYYLLIALTCFFYFCFKNYLENNFSRSKTQPKYPELLPYIIKGRSIVYSTILVTIIGTVLSAISKTLDLSCSNNPFLLIFGLGDKSFGGQLISAIACNEPFSSLFDLGGKSFGDKLISAFDYALEKFESAIIKIGGFFFGEWFAFLLASLFLLPFCSGVASLTAGISIILDPDQKVTKNAPSD